MADRVEVPAYRKIALDVAGKIYNGNFKEGEKIHGRSTLAGEYHVSPETIRRAMSLLEDMGVVSINQGSGIFIRSRQKAYEFLQRFQTDESIASLKIKIRELTEQKHAIENQILELLDQIIDYSNKLKNINPINPLEVEITESSALLGQTIIGSKFWQNTGATIVGIRRNGSLIISPGPYASFEKGDILLVVGDSGVLERTMAFIKGQQ